MLKGVRCLNSQIEAWEDTESHIEGLKIFSCLIATQQTWLRIKFQI